MLNRRLKQLRLSHGLSLDDLVAKMGGIVTKQALSKYEKGATKPSILVQSRLAEALGVKIAHLWIEPQVKVDFVAYRKGSGLRVKEQVRVENLVSRKLEERIRLEELTQQTNGSSLPIKEFKINNLSEVEKAAESLRDRWNLGHDPIAKVTGMLEDHHLHVIGIDASNRFDGISAIGYDEKGKTKAAAVVSRNGLPGDRQRFNLLHELGHLALDVSEEVDEERATKRYAAAVLAPAPEVFRIIGKKRNSIQVKELIALKQLWGLSIQAILFRLLDLEIISKNLHQLWFKYINHQGWKQAEPLQIPPEEPQWLSRTVYRALAEGLITKVEAEKLLESKVDIPEPVSLVKRRAFLKLPLEERRKILTEQAEKLSGHYDKLLSSPEWIGWQKGEFIEP